MGIHFKQDASLNDHARKLQRLVFEASITANATPADKRQSTDMAGAALLRTEGKTADADALEDVSSLVDAAASDENGLFAILIDTAQNEPRKIYSVSVTPSAGTVAIAATQVTPEGRILIDLNSSRDLRSESTSFIVEVDYLEQA